MKKTVTKLTNRENDIMELLWKSEKPLIASDIARMDDNLSINTVQSVLKTLLKKGLIEVADIVYSGKVLTRSYRTTITADEFAISQFMHRAEYFDKNISTSNIVNALLAKEKDEEEAILELEKLIQERKHKLRKED